MDEEMVKRLQDFAAGTMRDADAQLAFDAADVIEKMSKLADAIPHVCECCVGCELEKKNGGCDNAFVLSPKRAMQYLIKPRWIPVTEQKPSLPEDEDVCYVHVIAAVKGKKEAEPILYSRTYRLRDGKRVRIERFVCDGEVLEVTHWMPMPKPPEPPKEGQA